VTTAQRAIPQTKHCEAKADLAAIALHHIADPAMEFALLVHSNAVSALSREVKPATFGMREGADADTAGR
jgi:hypothetical protein